MKERGKAGEALLIQALQHLYREVVDVSEHPEWQKRDIDLLVDGTMVEVKTDTHVPKNLFFELTIDGKPGCVFQSRAQYWAVVFPKYHQAVLVNLPYLQWWLLHHQHQYPLKRIRSHAPKGKGLRYWDAFGVAIPISDLEAGGVPVFRMTLEE